MEKLRQFFQPSYTGNLRAAALFMKFSNCVFIFNILDDLIRARCVELFQKSVLLFKDIVTKDEVKISRKQTY